MNQQRTIVGWKEWVGLPDLTDIAVKAKVDTGAKTSALHAFYIRPFYQGETLFVEFHLHPHRQNTDIVARCTCPVADQREVTDSGGHKERRYVIATTIQIGNYQCCEQLTLTNRDTMTFRMLLGRNVLQKQFLVDSSLSFQLGGTAAKLPAF